MVALIGTSGIWNSYLENDTKIYKVFLTFLTCYYTFRKEKYLLEYN